MTQLPEKVYLNRAIVLQAVGGRRQLEKLEGAGEIKRVPLHGYKRAHYLRSEVLAVQKKMGEACG